MARIVCQINRSSGELLSLMISFTSASIEFRVAESSKINDLAPNIRKIPNRSDCSIAGSGIGSRKITSI